MASKEELTSRVWYIDGTLIDLVVERDRFHLVFNVEYPAKLVVSLACQKSKTLLHIENGKKYVVIYRISDGVENEVLRIFEIV